RTLRDRMYRLADLLRFRQPLKFDFCRMNMAELCKTIERVQCAQDNNPSTPKHIVAIGHTKDLTDVSTVANFLRYLKEHGIGISVFEDFYSRRFAPTAAVSREPAVFPAIQ